ncbi:hypothetical protein [Sphingopyxis macrogoltabida]|uniref:Uncharacterized protein n=1 Tax=Sphingopyxis macrogoltabida TaxID=33050 RepID=A0A0N9V4G0_SPHMC|nr:hypothetical protein AN936_23810 [Sphingopyxis macrogoltabida]
MNKVFDIGKFDLDVTLRDAALDPNCRPTKRMLANASIGVEPFDAYYSARELYETLQGVFQGLMALFLPAMPTLPKAHRGISIPVLEG